MRVYFIVKIIEVYYCHRFKNNIKYLRFSKNLLYYVGTHECFYFFIHNERRLYRIIIIIATLYPVSRRWASVRNRLLSFVITVIIDFYCIVYLRFRIITYTTITYTFVFSPSCTYLRIVYKLLFYEHLFIYFFYLLLSSTKYKKNYVNYYANQLIISYYYSICTLCITCTNNSIIVVGFFIFFYVISLTRVFLNVDIQELLCVSIKYV